MKVLSFLPKYKQPLNGFQTSINGFLEKMEYIFSRDLLIRRANSLTEIPFVSNTSLIFCPLWISSIPGNS